MVTLRLVLVSLLMKGRTCEDTYPNNMTVSFQNPVGTFEDCLHCIYVEQGQPFVLTCNVSDVIDQMIVTLTIHDISAVSVKVASVQNVFSLRRERAGSELHLKSISCEVFVQGFQRPLRVTTRIYVLLKPSEPRLTMSTGTDLRHLDIYCYTQGARPAPILTFLVGSETIKPNQSDSSYGSRNPSYHSEAKLEPILRSWNNNEVICCITHLTLASQLCSYGEYVHFNYEPQDVKISLSGINLASKPLSNLIEVACNVQDARPACDAITDLGEILVLNSTMQYLHHSHGGTSTLMTTWINVTAQDEELTLTCSANCSLFTDTTNDTVTLHLGSQVQDKPKSKTRSAMELVSVLWISGLIGATLMIFAVVTIVTRRLRQQSKRDTETSPSKNIASITRPVKTSVTYPTTGNSDTQYRAQSSSGAPPSEVYEDLNWRRDFEERVYGALTIAVAPDLSKP